MHRILKGLAVGSGVGAAGYAAYVAGSLLRSRKPRRASSDPLIDRFMPSFDAREHHQVRLDAPASATLAAAKAMRFDDSRIVRAIFKGRELVMGSEPTASFDKGLYEATVAMGWGVLADVPDRELVMGAVTKVWLANPVFRAPTGRVWRVHRP